MSDSTVKAYADRFDSVFDYIDRHLDEELSVECLSQVANFSKFHFHRQFTDYAGITATRYAQLMRLKRASQRLAFNSEARIIDIALEAGFESPESFTRAFKKVFGKTPTQFRKKPAWTPWAEQYRPPKRTDKRTMKIKIVDFPEVKVAALEHRGAPELVNDSVRSFIEWRKESGLSPVKSSQSYGIVYDNPETVEPAKFRFDICGSVSADVPENRQGVVTKTLPAGRCAVARHLGAHDRIGEVAYHLYRDWLPGSGEELRDFPLFFHYANLIPDTPEHELITDVYLPLK